MNAWRSRRERHRLPQFQLVERRRRAIDQEVAAVVVHHHVADRLRRLALQVLQQRDRGEDEIELAGGEGQEPRRRIGDDRILDAVEIGPARLPVIRVTGHPDVLVRLVLDEFERAGADRVLAHLRRRDMARIDRRLARGEQRDQIGLRPLQVKGDLVVAVGRDLLDVAIPRLARIDPELVGVDPAQPVPGAFDVGRGERLAVVPFDAAAQREGQLLAVLAPAPFGRQIGNDRCEAVLWHMLVEDDEVVEDAHHRDPGGDRQFLVDRHRGRAGEIEHLQDAAVFLCRCRRGGARQNQQTHRQSAQVSFHRPVLPLFLGWAKSRHPRRHFSLHGRLPRR